MKYISTNLSFEYYVNTLMKFKQLLTTHRKRPTENPGLFRERKHNASSQPPQNKYFLTRM